MQSGDTMLQYFQRTLAYYSEQLHKFVTTDLSIFAGEKGSIS